MLRPAAWASATILKTAGWSKIVKFTSAVTAAATQRGFDLGASRTMLFTDADYPTSNHIYRELGYRLVGSAVMIQFS